MTRILWADDEIDLLKPHVLFLEGKGFKVVTVNNGREAIDKASREDFDIIFLDENMPGISGLEVLHKVKLALPDVPVVMITRNEEEHIMEEAIGRKIADYLIKPVNPNQILLAIKKNLDERRLQSQTATQSYQREFMEIGMMVSDKLDIEGWKQVYRKLVHWELELEAARDEAMKQILDTQWDDANRAFGRFVSDKYLSMLSTTGDSGPVMSHNLMRRVILPEMQGPQPLFFILIDNLRFDHWKAIAPIIRENFKQEDEDLYLSILPTTTQYCRNSIFSGLLPADIEKQFPGKWSNDEDEGGRNQFEDFFLEDLLRRLRKDVKVSYTKVTNLSGAKDMVDNIPNLMNNKLNVIVYNFVDTLSHARTDSHVVRELAEDEAAYRSLMESWFRHSPLWDALQRISEMQAKVIISTDHGSVRVKEAVKIVGDRNTTTNLRYKQGKSLTYNPKEVFEIKKPEQAFLPRLHMSSTWVFARENDFFAYPNNYNHYVNYYRNTFQHGGISLEEMLIPIAILSSR
jgi:CheY-like chemotaxis protein